MTRTWVWIGVGVAAYLLLRERCPCRKVEGEWRAGVPGSWEVAGATREDCCAEVRRLGGM